MAIYVTVTGVVDELFNMYFDQDLHGNSMSDDAPPFPFKAKVIYREREKRTYVEIPGDPVSWSVEWFEFEKKTLK